MFNEKSNNNVENYNVASFSCDHATMPDIFCVPRTSFYIEPEMADQECTEYSIQLYITFFDKYN